MDAALGISQLKKDGFRMGKGRSAILEVFEQAKKPLSAPEILALLFKKQVQINKTTVYRELEFLKNKNLIRQVPVSSNTEYYESALQNHHHHLVCESCSMMVEIETSELEKNIQNLTSTVAKNKQFTIESHALEFFGKCANCS